MFKWPSTPPSLCRTLISVFFIVFFIPPQIVVADVEASALQYVARRLLPNECQSVIINPEDSQPSNPVPKSYKFATNGIDCFRKLVGWASNLRANKKDANLLLGNRLRQIGRDDLASWLIGPTYGGGPVTEETIEYDSWDSKKKKSDTKKFESPAHPEISDKSIYGSSPIKSIAGLSPGYRQLHSMSYFPDMRKLNGIRNPDSYKDRYLVMADPGDLAHSITPAPSINIPTNSLGHDISVPGSVVTPKQIDPKSSTTTIGSKIPVEYKQNDSKIQDAKTFSCLRVPLGTALLVIGTIMILTCCCALLLRNRLAACFERLRGKKGNNKSNKRISADEEQGFMGPRTVGKPPKRSGRKGGGPVDVVNVGVQKGDGNPQSNGSAESEEKPTGCCNCCSARRKKKSRRKWKK